MNWSCRQCPCLVQKKTPFNWIPHVRCNMRNTGKRSNLMGFASCLLGFRLAETFLGWVLHTILRSNRLWILWDIDWCCVLACYTMCFWGNSNHQTLKLCFCSSQIFVEGFAASDLTNCFPSHNNAQFCSNLPINQLSLPSHCYFRYLTAF